MNGGIGLRLVIPAEYRQINLIWTVARRYPLISRAVTRVSAVRVAINNSSGLFLSYRRRVRYNCGHCEDSWRFQNNFLISRAVVLTPIRIEPQDRTVPRIDISVPCLR